MNNRRPVGLWVCLLFLIVSSCGPSPEELAATSAAKTAVAASPTPLPTSTPTITPTPTPTPTATPTPTPIPEPDPKAMLKWQEVGFPDGIIALPPEVRGVEEGAYAFSLVASNGSLKEYFISGSFAFDDDREDPSQLIYGYSVLLPSIQDQNSFDDFSLNYLVLVVSSAVGGGVNHPVVDIPDSEDIGDLSVGKTVQYFRLGELWELNVVAFRVDDIGAWVFIRNDANLSNPVDIVKVASVYADSIQRPFQTCKLTSLESNNNADVPGFIFEAEGFYPSEGRMILLKGNLLLGDEIKSVTNAKLGGGGESVDPDGRITDEIGFYTPEQLTAQGMEGAVLPSGPNEFILIIRGLASGCEIEQSILWTGDSTVTSTPTP